MANRILRDYTDSISVNELSEGAETFFVRLMMKADDFGKFHGNPKLLKASLYPLRDTVNEKKVMQWLNECVKNGLVMKYCVNNRDFIQIRNFGQRLRSMRSEYPDPEPDTLNDSNPRTIDSGMRTIDSNPPPETKRNEVETETETKAVDTAPDDWDLLMKKWVAYRKEKKKPLTPSGIPIALNELKEMSGGKIEIAQKIVNKSISSGWQGLFPLDNYSKPLTPTSKPIMKNGNFGKL